MSGFPIRRLPTPEAFGQATYQIGPDKYITFDERDVREYGIEECLRAAGHEPPTGHVPVFQYGKKIGTVPASFDPATARSNSFFYEIRAYDFTRKDQHWEAHHSLGPGDLNAVPGFIWEQGNSYRADKDLEALSQIFSALSAVLQDAPQAVGQPVDREGDDG